MNFIVETTCDGCSATAIAEATLLIVGLPAQGDQASLPAVLTRCPACGEAGVSQVPWRLAAQLLTAGATYISAPDDEVVRPRYPERLPVAAGTAMSLDDLIDLRAELDSGSAF